VDSFSSQSRPSRVAGAVPGTGWREAGRRDRTIPFRAALPQTTQAETRVGVEDELESNHWRVEMGKRHGFACSSVDCTSPTLTVCSQVPVVSDSSLAHTWCTHTSCMLVREGAGQPKARLGGRFVAAGRLDHPAALASLDTTSARTDHVDAAKGKGPDPVKGPHRSGAVESSRVEPGRRRAESPSRLRCGRWTARWIGPKTCC
jgi:hypothetical protein